MTAKLKTTTPITKVVAACATTLALLTALVLLASGPANAGTIGYSGTTTSGTITINSGANQTQLTNPDAHIDLQIDDVTRAATATTTFTPTYTPTFVGPFDLVFYAGASITQQGTSTGTVAANGDVTLDLQARLAITVFNRVGATPDPATDQKFTGPGCFVDVSFDLTGHLDEGTGVLTVSDSQFTIPQFPAGDTNCWLATDELNNRLAGANNAVDLTFGGVVTSTTTSTTTTTEATTSTSTTSTTSTTSSTTSTTIDPCLPTVGEDCNPEEPGGLTTPGTPASSTTTSTTVPPTTTPNGSGGLNGYWED